MSENPTVESSSTADETTLDDDDTVVKPDTEVEVETVEDSPAERIESVLGEEVHRKFIAADDDHPLVQTAGSKEAMTSSTPVEVQQMLADEIYVDEATFFREWKQNHIAAVVREAKRRLKNEHGEEALYYEHEHDHPDLDGTRRVLLPKDAATLLDEARDIGYLPTVEFEVNKDEGKLITRDNGIGMTTGEVLNIWNEPAISGSGTDQSSAGTKGIGALTWVSIAGSEGAVHVKTRTRREETLSGEPVPERDQQGFEFYSYLGGVVPIPGEPPEGFYGTEFHIPWDPDEVYPDQFKEQFRQYAEVLPVTVTFNVVEDGVTDDDEFDATTFVDRYEEEPNIVIDRPGEFRIALGRPDVVSKGYDDEATFLLDNPIDRNLGRGTAGSTSFDTLWNDHVQLLNEQGLIVAGPNRGKTASQVDTLAGDIGDITDEDEPMPDVPMPEPTASRDSFQRDEALARFFTYASHIAEQREVEEVADFVDTLLTADTPTHLVERVREGGGDWELFRKLSKQHMHRKTMGSLTRLWRELDKWDGVAFDADNLTPEMLFDEVDGIEKKLYSMFDDPSPFTTTRNDQGAVESVEITNEDAVKKTLAERISAARVPEMWLRHHPKADLLETMVALDEPVSYATSSTHGDPNKKGNRSTHRLAHVIGTLGRWPIYVGGTLNKDRCTVLWHDDNEPDAVAIKDANYSKWTAPPWNAGRVKDVPFSQDGAGAWTVPDEVHGRRQTAPPTRSTSDGDDGDGDDTEGGDGLRGRTLNVRCTENASVDTVATVGALEDALDATEFGDVISDGVAHNFEKPWMVVFPTTHEQNISDHYNLSQYAVIVKCISDVADRLLRHPQAFLPEEFEPMLADASLPAYSLDDDEFRSVTPPELSEMMKSYRAEHRGDKDYDGDVPPTKVYLTPEHAEAAVSDYLNVLWGYPARNYDLDPADDQWVEKRSHIIDAGPLPDPRAADDFDDDTLLVFWTGDVGGGSYDGDFERFRQYLHLTNAPSVLGRLRNSHSNLANTPDELITHGSKGVRGRVLKRAQYPQWSPTSESWNRAESSHSTYGGGLYEPESALLKACRDLGIDPFEDHGDDPERLRQALVMLATTCPGGDADE